MARRFLLPQALVLTAALGTLGSCMTVHADRMGAARPQPGTGAHAAHDASGGDPAPRCAMMDKHMQHLQHMPAAQRERHLEMLREHCRQQGPAGSADTQ